MIRCQQQYFPTIYNSSTDSISKLIIHQSKISNYFCMNAILNKNVYASILVIAIQIIMEKVRYIINIIALCGKPSFRQNDTRKTCKKLGKVSNESINILFTTTYVNHDNINKDRGHNRQGGKIILFTVNRHIIINIRHEFRACT